MSTQDLLQLNHVYGCELQETLQCQNWRFDAERVYLRTRLVQLFESWSRKNDLYYF